MFANSLWIYYVLREFTINSFHRELTTSLRVNFQFTINFGNPFSIQYLLSWIYYESPTCSQIYFEFTMFFANSTWIHFITIWQPPCAFTFNSLSISRIHFQFNIFFRDALFSLIHNEFPDLFANSLRIYSVFAELTSNSLSCREFNLISLSFSPFHFKFPLFFANSLRIHFLFRDSISNSLSSSRIHFEFFFFFANSLTIPFEFITYELTICFANLFLIYYIFRRFTLDSLRIFYLLREFTLNSPTISRMNTEFTLFFANSL